MRAAPARRRAAVEPRPKYSLLGGVRELVFPSAIVALLYTGIRPQILDRLHERALERRHRLEVHAPHEFRLFLVARGKKKKKKSEFLRKCVSKTELDTK